MALVNQMDHVIGLTADTRYTVLCGTQVHYFCLTLHFSKNLCIPPENQV